MLTALRISDYAILESVELTLGPGLTAITGETGAGKSILLDALGLVLGGRASDKAVRHGRDQAEVEVQFEGVADPLVLGDLRELGVALDDNATVVLRRVVGAGPGKNRCWVNGRLITAGQLKRLASPLVDLSAQHAQHRLLEPAAHLEVLDRFAGHGALLAQYGAVWQNWHATQQSLEALRARQRQAADRLDYLRFVHKELAELKPVRGELAEIQSKIAKLRATEQIAKTLGDAVAGIDGDDGARELASRAARALARLEALDPKLGELAERARELEALAGDLGFDLASYARGLSRDDRDLSRLAERQDALLRAIKKHGGSEDALVDRLAQVEAELDQDTTELRLHELERDEARLRRECEGVAAELHERRQLAARPLALRISEVVRQLGMPSASVRLDLVERTGQLSQTGWTHAAMWLRANLGENEGPLQDVASGGELSRVLLAVQRALGDAAWSESQLTQGHGDAERGTLAQLPTAVYDEADAGLSGTTGLVLGRFLREIGARQQVICISHLPQVAAAADSHIAVQKREHDGRTTSGLRQLSGEARVAELARMLGVVEGERDTALEHARQLLRGQAASGA